jgi:hypothetical protein
MARVHEEPATTPVATAAGVVLLLTTAACAAGMPHAGGEPVAPLAPNHLWRPPRSARGDDPPRGVAEGERVITDGQSRLTSGAHVRVVGVAATAPLAVSAP